MRTARLIQDRDLKTPSVELFAELKWQTALYVCVLYI